MSPPGGREQTKKGNWYLWTGVCVSELSGEAEGVFPEWADTLGTNLDEEEEEMERRVWEWIEERHAAIPDILRIDCPECGALLGPYIDGDIDRLVDDHYAGLGNCVLNRVHWTTSDWNLLSGFAKTRGPKPVLYYWFGVDGRYGDGVIVQEVLRLGSTDRLKSSDGLGEQQIEDWINGGAEA